MPMQTWKLTLLAILAVAVSAAAHAQRRYSDQEIVSAISQCMIENAPENWLTLIFTLEPAPALAGKEQSAAVQHKVIVGAESSPPSDLRPCRPDYIQKAVNTFRENQDEKARGWTGITLTVHKDGRFSVTFHYPK